MLVSPILRFFFFYCELYKGNKNVWEFQSPCFNKFQVWYYRKKMTKACSGFWYSFHLPSHWENTSANKQLEVILNCSFNNISDPFSVWFSGVLISHGILCQVLFFSFLTWAPFLLLTLIQGKNLVLEATCYQMASQGGSASLLQTLQMQAECQMPCLVFLSFSPGFSLPAISFLGS